MGGTKSSDGCSYCVELSASGPDSTRAALPLTVCKGSDDERPIVLLRMPSELDVPESKALPEEVAEAAENVTAGTVNGREPSVAGALLLSSSVP